MTWRLHSATFGENYWKICLAKYYLKKSNIWTNIPVVQYLVQSASVWVRWLYEQIKKERDLLHCQVGQMGVYTSCRLMTLKELGQFWKYVPLYICTAELLSPICLLVFRLGFKCSVFYRYKHTYQSLSLSLCRVQHTTKIPVEAKILKSPDPSCNLLMTTKV